MTVHNLIGLFDIAYLTKDNITVRQRTLLPLKIQRLLGK